MFSSNKYLKYILPQQIYLIYIQTMASLKEIGEKRQKKRKETNLYKVNEDQNKKKFYVLEMFPYPSGAGLHVGHPK